MTMTRFSTPDEIVRAYRTNPEQFCEMQNFDRLAGLGGGKFERNPSGRLIIVPAGEHLYAIPHPDIRIDAVTYHGTGYKKFFECRGYEEGGSYRDHELIAPAMIESTGVNTYIIAGQGVLQVK